MLKIYYEKDADISILKGKKILPTTTEINGTKKKTAVKTNKSIL